MCYFVFVLYVFGFSFLTVKSEFEPAIATIASIQNSIYQDGIKCEEIIKKFLERIEKNNNKGPNLNAVISINPNAIDEAKIFDSNYNLYRRRTGALSCVPFLIKDNIDVAGIPTTGGVNVLRNQVPMIDSAPVAAVKSQGAIILGKTNMAPLASWSAKSESETGGLVRNPYGLEYTTYGSSGGNSAAGAAMFAVVGLGTETGMSITLPASAGNLVGVRPTWGSFPLIGVVPASESQDVVGPFTKKVEDAALVMDILIGARNPMRMNRNALRGKRIGVLIPFTYIPVNVPVGNLNFTYIPEPDVQELFHTAIENVKQAGAYVTNVTGGNFQDVFTAFVEMFGASASLSVCRNDEMNHYFGDRERFGREAPIHSLKELLDKQELPDYFQTTMEDDYSKRAACPRTLVSFQQARRSFNRNIMNRLLQTVDVIIMPTTDSFPGKLDGAPEKASGALMASYAGYPSLDLPIGFSSPKSGAPNGLPFGALMIAKPENEEKLLQIAYSYQQQFPNMKLPESLEEEDGGNWFVKTWNSFVKGVKSVFDGK